MSEKQRLLFEALMRAHIQSAKAIAAEMRADELREVAWAFEQGWEIAEAAYEARLSAAAKGMKT